MAMDAFDLAERMQQIIFVMSDLDLGMNMWMSRPFSYPEKPFDRGKVLDADSLKKLGEWGRYKDVDGDGITYRTLPGTNMPSYFTRGSGHNERGQYSERPDDYQRNVDRLLRKQETARTLVPRRSSGPASRERIIAGLSDWGDEESRVQLEEQSGINTAYLRLRAYPFPDEVAAFMRRYPRIYIVEQNRDAQMKMLLRNDLPIDATSHARSVLHYNGLPIDARSVTDEILIQEGRKTRPAGAAVAVAGVAVLRED
jgi:2-oxoglutarate ferredoxin oxidoreductase subunit alpha